VYRRWRPPRSCRSCLRPAAQPHDASVRRDEPGGEAERPDPSDRSALRARGSPSSPCSRRRTGRPRPSRSATPLRPVRRCADRSRGAGACRPGPSAHGRAGRGEPAAGQAHGLAGLGPVRVIVSDRHRPPSGGGSPNAAHVSADRDHQRRTPRASTARTHALSTARAFAVAPRSSRTPRGGRSRRARDRCPHAPTGGGARSDRRTRRFHVSEITVVADVAQRLPDRRVHAPSVAFAGAIATSIARTIAGSRRSSDRRPPRGARDPSRAEPLHARSIASISYRHRLLGTVEHATSAATTAHARPDGWERGDSDRGHHDRPSSPGRSGPGRDLRRRHRHAASVGRRKGDGLRRVLLPRGSGPTLAVSRDARPGNAIAATAENTPASTYRGRDGDAGSGSTRTEPLRACRALAIALARTPRAAGTVSRLRWHRPGLRLPVEWMTDPSGPLLVGEWQPRERIPGTMARYDAERPPRADLADSQERLMDAGLAATMCTPGRGPSRSTAAAAQHEASVQVDGGNKRRGRLP
jgi:hypothetical protein